MNYYQGKEGSSIDTLQDIHHDVLAEKDPQTIVMLSKINTFAISMLMNNCLKIKDHMKVALCGEDALGLIKIIKNLPAKERETNNFYNKALIFVLLLKASSDHKVSPVINVIKNLKQCVEFIDSYEANLKIWERKRFISV